MAKLIIEICPREPRTSACLINGESVHTDSDTAAHMADCTGSGDAQEACEFVLDQVGVEFRIVAKDAAGNYENRLATDDEKGATARAIYFESETDFTDSRMAELYLVWDAANSLEEESE